MRTGGLSLAELAHQAEHSQPRLQHYQISETTGLRCLLRLDAMGLIDLLPGKRIRLKVARDFD